MPPLPVLCQARLAQKSLTQGRLEEAKTIFGNVLSGLTITHLDTDRSIEAAWVRS